MCNKAIEATRGATGGTNSILDSTLNQNYDPEGPDQSQQNMGDPDDQEDEDDESDEESDSDEDEDGVEEVGMDDSDEEEGEDDAEVYFI